MNSNLFWTWETEKYVLIFNIILFYDNIKNCDYYASNWM